MKKIQLLNAVIYSLLLAFSTTVHSQNRCKTPELMQELISSTPELQGKIAASELKIENWTKTQKAAKVASVLTVPVVVHVLYRNAAQNISDAQIQLQLDILNSDYRKRNYDTTGIPTAFKSLAVDCEIDFCLAKRDPLGNPTNGITRKAITIKEIGNTNKYFKSNLGGQDIWNRDYYLNFWVCEIDSMGGILGYSTVPSFNPSASSDGVVIDYRYFGTSSNSHYNKGRTATHEVGHWFDLQHIWGDDFGACSNDDFVSDTPIQGAEHYGMPAFPSLDVCSATFPGTMFMNYMDYTDDSGMHMFTLGQKTRMWAALSTTLRDSLFASKGCVPVGINENNGSSELNIRPNPSTGSFNFSLQLKKAEAITIQIFDLAGHMLLQKNYLPQYYLNENIDLAEFANGCYIARIIYNTNTLNKKLVKN